MHRASLKDKLAMLKITKQFVELENVDLKSKSLESMLTAWNRKDKNYNHNDNDSNTGNDSDNDEDEAKYQEFDTKYFAELHNRIVESIYLSNQASVNGDGDDHDDNKNDNKYGDDNHKVEDSEQQQSMMNEINRWIEKTNEMKDISFMNENAFKKDYENSLELQNMQSNRLLSFSDKVKEIFFIKLNCEQDIRNSKQELEKENKNSDVIEEKLQCLKTDLTMFMSEIAQKCEQYSNTCQIYKETMSQQSKCQKTTEKLKQQHKNSQNRLEFATTMLDKYNKFNNETSQCIDNLADQRSDKINEFEEKWLQWSYSDIVFWFKTILHWFEHNLAHQQEIIMQVQDDDINDNFNDVQKQHSQQQNHHNDKVNQSEMEDNNHNDSSDVNIMTGDMKNGIDVDEDEDEDEDDDGDKNEIESKEEETSGGEVLLINFNGVYKNLKSQKIHGKFLSLVNKADLRNLGFESFEHQCILSQSIEKLVEKYPIPKDDIMQTEGGNRSITGGGSGGGNGNNDGMNGDNDEPGAARNKSECKYFCPITDELMSEPVIAYDGCTYEKSAIVEYIKTNKMTPNSNVLLSEEEIQTNLAMLFLDHALKKQIKDKFGE